MMRMAVRLPALGKRLSKVATSRIAVTVHGSMAGRQNRLPTGCRSTSRMTKPCASHMKPSIRPCTLKAEVLSNASWWAVCTADVRCAFRGPELGMCNGLIHGYFQIEDKTDCGCKTRAASCRSAWQGLFASEVSARPLTHVGAAVNLRKIGHLINSSPNENASGALRNFGLLT